MFAGRTRLLPEVCLAFCPACTGSPAACKAVPGDSLTLADRLCVWLRARFANGSSRGAGPSVSSPVPGSEGVGQASA